MELEFICREFASFICHVKDWDSLNHYFANDYDRAFNVDHSYTFMIDEGNVYNAEYNRSFFIVGTILFMDSYF